MKAYSLKRATIQSGAHAKPDQEMAIGASEGAGADVSNEKSEGRELQENLPIDIDEGKRSDESGEV